MRMTREMPLRRRRVVCLEDGVTGGRQKRQWRMLMIVGGEHGGLGFAHEFLALGGYMARRGGTVGVLW